MFLLTLIAFILILGLLIFVHEGGHFLAAKVAGVKVEEFAFGFPPRLFSVKRGETAYSLNLIPLGGYVKLLGEEDPSQPRSLASKSALTRLMVLGAGAFMNALLPIILFSVAFMIPRQVAVGDIRIEEVAPNSPAAVAGIKPGDTILSINGQTVDNPGNLRYNIQLSLGRETTLELKGEDGLKKTVTLVPRWNPPEGQGPVGIMQRFVPQRQTSQSYPLWEAVPKGAKTSWETLTLMRNEVASWFVQKKVPQISGPVGIFEITGEATAAGPSYLMWFAAFLSINLAIINLFPLPALDGGRIAFVVLGIIRRGKRVSPQKERLVHLIGFVLLISLIIVVSFFDIMRVVRGESLVP